MFHCLFHIEDLTTQWKDGLKASIPTLLCSSTCGVTLNKVEFASLGVALGAICKFSWQSATAQNALSLNQFPCFASRSAGLGSQNYFLNDIFCFPRIFFEVCFKNL